jgi:alginate O-acetyltransferase complex protein AlgI
MNYTDPAFPVFFLLVFIVYYTLRSARGQVAVLILASLVFYAWHAPWLVSLLLLTWAITTATSYRVLRSESDRVRRRIVTIGVVLNLSILALFKYKSLVPSQYYVGSALESIMLLPLPIGISFYIFHGISLLIDVYRGRALTNRFSRNTSPIDYAAASLLYLVFFPQLIAGPIVKAKDFIPQISPKRIAEIEWFFAINSLITGFFLKAVIADNLSAVTFWIQYPYFQWKSSIDLAVLLYGYSFQIFSDFAGYSLIAIGLAALLGYRLPENFNFPYAARSISDFWRRWHISLSSWLRDYLYIPLGGNRHGALRTNLNLMIVMILGGLWHGAAWSFALWGLWHGIGLVLERPLLSRKNDFAESRTGIVLRIFLVFNFVTLGWLFFKLQNSNEAFLYLKTMVSQNPYHTSSLTLLLISMFGLPVVIYHLMATTRIRPAPVVARVIKGMMLFLVVTSAGPAVDFIYFQF